MNNRKEGDLAVRKLERRFEEITKSKKGFEDKLKLVTAALHEAAVPWNLKGDDRVLCEMSIAAGAAVEKAAKAEIEI